MLAPQNITELASIVSLADVGAAFLSIASALISIYVVHKGIKLLLLAIHDSEDSSHGMSRADYNWYLFNNGEYMPRQDFE